MTWLEAAGLIGFLIGTGLTVWLVEKQRRKTYPVPAGYQGDIEFPHDEDFELYHNALSLCSMKTRLCLAELGVPYKSHHIDLIETGCYENIRPRLLAINPGGTVPVLLHQGHPIYESHEQIRYAAKFAPDGAPSLIPDDPSRREEMEDWIDRSSLTADPLANAHKTAGNAVPGLTLPLFVTMVEKIPYWRIAEGLLFHFDKMRPMMFSFFKLRGIENLAKMPPAAKTIANSRREMGTHLDALETQLAKSGGPWILGEMFTLADVSWLVILERLRQANAEAAFLGNGKRPRIERYWERLKSRPAYTEAILDQSHPAIEYGTRRIKEARADSPALRECLDGNDEAQ
jgi:glutathione S-transferase